MLVQSQYRREAERPAVEPESSLTSLRVKARLNSGYAPCAAVYRLGLQFGVSEPAVINDCDDSHRFSVDFPNRNICGNSCTSDLIASGRK
jgi:hypothetical protein